MTMEILPEHVISDAANNNIKTMDCAQPKLPQPERRGPGSPMCIGCNKPIVDQYVLRVHPDLEWHMSCLKCVECNISLDENCTCFLRDGKTYCKNDYKRLFMTLCAKCGNTLTTNDLVMRAENNVYHIDCFRCNACSRQLQPGDEFSLRDAVLFCRDDSEVLDRNSVLDNDTDNLIPNINNNTHNTRNLHHHQEVNRSLHDPVCSNKIKRKDGKPTRVRTVLTEKQLQTLRTCYMANPRPDSLMKDQLVEMTGLTPRVIRVWFQNKRCKDKKKSILMKQLHHQEKNMPGSMQGVQMVAQSPLRHENGMKSIDSYHQQTWKQMPDYNPAGHQEEINHNSFSSMMGPLYGNDDTAVYIPDDEYMDCLQPDSVSSQFSGASTSPHSST